MKVVELQNGFGIESLKLTERPIPKVSSGQVLIKMQAASLNYRDLIIINGALGLKHPLPFIPLSDGVGEVVEVGEGVTRVKTGDRVAGIFFQNWLSGELGEMHPPSSLGGALLYGGALTDTLYGKELPDAQIQSLLGNVLNGVLAEYIVLPEYGVVHVPEHLTNEEAATLPCAAVTSWNAVVTSSGIKAGDTVLVLGTGGASLFALQFAQLSGARVIATSSSDEKIEKLHQLGVLDTINYKKTPDWGNRVQEMTGGVGVDLVVEVGGPGTLNESLRAVRYGGKISFFGSLTGGDGVVNTGAIFLKSLQLQGIYVGSREMFEEMNRAIALHKMRPIVDRVFAFEEIGEALAYEASGAHFGKICIRF